MFVIQNILICCKSKRLQINKLIDKDNFTLLFIDTLTLSIIKGKHIILAIHRTAQNINKL